MRVHAPCPLRGDSGKLLVSQCVVFCAQLVLSPLGMAGGPQKIVGILPNHYIHVLDLVSSRKITRSLEGLFYIPTKTMVLWMICR